MTHLPPLPSPRASLIGFALLLAFGGTACAVDVVGGAGAGGSGGAGASMPTPTAPAAIAILASQMDQGTGGAGGSGTSGSGGGTTVDPNTLYLELGTPAPTCAVPTPVLPCGDSFGVFIGLPPALQQVGTIPLSTPSLNSFASESGPLNEPSAGPDDCPGGGGSFITGTLDIESIDATQVVFRLSGTGAFDLNGSSADGEYVAARCP
jgi:hypothetical protein